MGPIAHIDLVDGYYIWLLKEIIGQYKESPIVWITHLKECLADTRRKCGLPKAERAIFFLARDRNRMERIQKFLDILEENDFHVEQFDYKSTNLTHVHDYFKQHHDLQSFSPQMAYAIGLLAQKKESSVVVISHLWDLYWPLKNYIHRGHKAVLMCAQCCLDKRWYGNFSTKVEEKQILFWNMDQYMKELCGFSFADLVQEQTHHAFDF